MMGPEPDGLSTGVEFSECRVGVGRAMSARLRDGDSVDQVVQLPATAVPQEGDGLGVILRGG
jgi:hypothetical protein